MKTVKLGRIRPPALPMVPRLSRYMAPMASPPPAAVDYSAKARDSIQRIYANDKYGCCVISGKAHAVGVWSGNDGPTTIVGADSEIVSEYKRICGPGDNGCVITNVLDAMRSGGLLLGGSKRKIDGYVAIEPTSADQVKVALIVFGGFTIGFNVPSAWVGQAAYDGGVWDTPRSYSFVGGHDMRAVGYNDKGVQFATWGFIVTVTWRAMSDSRIMDEAYAELSPDWYGSDKLAPSGIDAAKLKDDIDAFSRGELPDWQPVAPDPPAPPDPPPIPPPTPGVGLTILPGTLLGEMAVKTYLADANGQIHQFRQIPRYDGPRPPESVVEPLIDVLNSATPAQVAVIRKRLNIKETS
jgi:hypothetical protein